MFKILLSNNILNLSNQNSMTFVQKPCADKSVTSLQLEQVSETAAICTCMQLMREHRIEDNMGHHSSHYPIPWQTCWKTDVVTTSFI